ncbi:MAG: biopolymer transporter ExbD [Planctomycetota bacterium]
MKFSPNNGPSIIRLPLVPLIDVMFLLLMFFVLHLKGISPERQFTVNLPSGPPSSATATGSAASLPDIKVGLRSDRNGRLTQLTLGSKNLGNDDAAFDRLNREILQLIGRPGHPLTKDVEVEIDADYETHYRFVVKAISKCTGRMDPQTRQIARYVEKIKFAPPHKPKA